MNLHLFNTIWILKLSLDVVLIYYKEDFDATPVLSPITAFPSVSIVN